MDSVITRAVMRQARKPHACDWCPERIYRGDRYGRWAIVLDNRARTVKLCGQCSEFADEYAYKGGGEFSREDAIDWAVDFYGPDDAAFWFLARIGWWGE